MAAAKFEIDPTLFSKWLAARRADGSEAFRGRGVRTELEAENALLKKEKNDLKLEREILKKRRRTLPSTRLKIRLYRHTEVVLSD